MPSVKRRQVRRLAARVASYEESCKRNPQFSREAHKPGSQNRRKTYSARASSTRR